LAPPPPKKVKPSPIKRVNGLLRSKFAKRKKAVSGIKRKEIDVTKGEKQDSEGSKEIQPQTSLHCGADGGDSNRAVRKLKVNPTVPAIPATKRQPRPLWEDDFF